MYRSEALWSFFHSRIPGLGQRKVQQIIEEENIDPTDDISLLKKFGEYSIANPFKLIALSVVTTP